jgi:hypothetical protein
MGTDGHTHTHTPPTHKEAYCRKKVHYPFPNPCNKKKVSSENVDSYMANKETRLFILTEHNDKKYKQNMHCITTFQPMTVAP